MCSRVGPEPSEDMNILVSSLVQCCGRLRAGLWEEWGGEGVSGVTFES